MANGALMVRVINFDGLIKYEFQCVFYHVVRASRPLTGKTYNLQKAGGDARTTATRQT